MSMLRNLFRPEYELGTEGVIVPLEYEDTRPVKVFRAILLWLSALVIFILFLATITPMRELAIGTGQIIPDGNVVSVQHLEGGIVAELLVRQGQMVKEGQPLLRLDSIFASSDVGQLQARRAGLDMKRLRLQALLEGKQPDFSGYTKTHAEQALEQMKNYERDRTAFSSNRNALFARVEQRQAEHDAAVAEQTNLTAQVAIQAEQLRLKRQLATQGYAPQAAVLEQQSVLEQTKARAIQNKGQAESSRQALSEAKSMLVQFESQFQRERSEELTKALAEIAELDEGLQKQNDKLDRTFVRASTAGLVQEILPRSVGEVVKPGDLIAKIVPSDMPLIAEVRLKPDDIGHVTLGQHASIQITTFDTEVFGKINGVVSWVSASTFETQRGELFYKAIIELDRNSVAHNQDIRPIMPGMVVNAKIVTGSKSLMRYFLKPIARSVDSAFSER